jgi:DNA-binding LacI/PurR family transcriptional regulator
MGRQDLRTQAPKKQISLKELAAYLELNPATVSVVLNDVPGRSIPEVTRERIRAAAIKFNYQPSFLARSLRNNRTMTIGILSPLLAEGYHAEVMSGIGDHLMEQEYLYFIVRHGHRRDLIEKYSRLLIGRGAEGLIAVDTHVAHTMAVPVVALPGHRRIKGVNNVVLDHRRAAELALRHLYDLGHRKIAFMKGQPYSSDSDDRWRSTVNVARELGIMIQPELTIQLDRDLSSPELGYPVVQHLLMKRRHFTAMLSFNDEAALGAMRALHEAHFRVPDDVSVVGFDDIKAAAFHTPSLTTIRQPLHAMGALAAAIVLDRIRGQMNHSQVVRVEPELIVRESTQALQRRSGARKRRGPEAQF